MFTSEMLSKLAMVRSIPMYMGSPVRESEID